MKKITIAGFFTFNNKIKYLSIIFNVNEQKYRVFQNSKFPILIQLLKIILQLKLFHNTRVGKYKFDINNAISSMVHQQEM